MKSLSRIEWYIKVTGLIILALGVSIGFADLMGWFEDTDRQAFLNWLYESRSGLAIETPAAQAFIKDFPPPGNSSPFEITHITKLVRRLENGLISETQINFMYSDHSRSDYVATLNDVKAWAEKTSFPWFSWVITLVGFFVVCGSTLIEWKYDITPFKSIKTA